MWAITKFGFWKCSKTGSNLVGVDLTVLSAQCHPTVPECVSFYSAWKGKEIYYYYFFLTITFEVLKKILGRGIDGSPQY